MVTIQPTIVYSKNAVCYVWKLNDKMNKYGRLCVLAWQTNLWEKSVKNI